MRLVHVMPRYWPAEGGAERYWQEISERAAAAGHAVEVLTTDALDIELFWQAGRQAVAVKEDTHNGVHIRRFPLRHSFPTSLGYRGIRRALLIASDLQLPFSVLHRLAQQAPASPGLARALSEYREPTDLIAGVNIVYEGLLVAAHDLARRRRIPFVFCPFTHLGEPGSASPVGRFYTMRHQLALARDSDALLVSTRGEADYFRGQGVRGERLIRMGTGITPEKVMGGEASRARLEYDLQRPVFLFVGTVSRDKGAEQAVLAVGELATRGIDATLVLAGPPLAEFRRWFEHQDPALQARCRLAGFVPEAHKRDLLAACDALVLPSRTDLFPTVLLEAWLYGKPVIVARAGGVPDVVREDENGLLVPFGDAPALASAMERVLRDTAHAQEMGERGRAQVYAQYTWDRLYARVEATFLRLVQGQSVADLSWDAPE